jgi:hypothetical protein
VTLDATVVRMTKKLGSAALFSKIYPKEENVGLFSKDIETMDDLFVHTLRDIYYAEKQIGSRLMLS